MIVNKSTVPVGTGEIVRDIIQTNRRRNVDFDVVSNPEFLREGSAINDTLNPDRIVIGAPTQDVAMRMLELYAPLERPMLITDVARAEMIKYASNAFLATKISFINAIANICEKAGADVMQVMKGMGYDQRIGEAFLQAGLGYGGSCFPKDTLALIGTADQFGYDFRLLKSVVEINQCQAPASWTDWKRSSTPLTARQSPCWELPSSRTRTTFAKRSHWKSLRGCSVPAPRSVRTILSRWIRLVRSSRRSVLRERHRRRDGSRRRRHCHGVE